jgi:hypothetical protein
MITKKRKEKGSVAVQACLSMPSGNTYKKNYKILLTLHYFFEKVTNKNSILILLACSCFLQHRGAMLFFFL